MLIPINFKKDITIVALTGALAVLIGAFGAHALKPELSDTSMKAYQTGVQYHFYHVASMFVLLLFYLQSGNTCFRQSFYLFFFGILAFSGSLYLISTSDYTGLNINKWIGPVTPLGGALFIVGWLNLIRAGTIDHKY